MFPVADDVINQLLDQLKFDHNGLIPAIAQDIHSKEILMMAWQNQDAIRASLTEGAGIYYSRSRKALWRKGESSGNLQKLISFRFDCDQDAIIMLVEQTGPACHTNRRSCFYNEVHTNNIQIMSDYG